MLLSLRLQEPINRGCANTQEFPAGFLIKLELMVFFKNWDDLLKHWRKPLAAYTVHDIPDGNERGYDHAIINALSWLPAYFCTVG
jgi:hypothetical protein